MFDHNAETIPHQQVDVEKMRNFLKSCFDLKPFVWSLTAGQIGFMRMLDIFDFAQRC